MQSATKKLRNEKNSETKPKSSEPVDPSLPDTASIHHPQPTARDKTTPGQLFDILLFTQNGAKRVPARSLFTFGSCEIQSISQIQLQPHPG
jgi:hypothetical protein